MRRTLLLMLLAASATASTYGQSSIKEARKTGFFTDLEVGITAGTTGLGLDISTPMSGWARLHLGGSFMPKAEYNARFSTEIGEGLSTKVQDSRFEKMTNTMQSFLGVAPTKYVDMEAMLHMNHFKLLIDVFPFKNNRHWYVTAGVYIGNGDIVTVRNSPQSMNNLVAMKAYNQMYSNALADKALVTYVKDDGEKYELDNDDLKKKFRSWGRLQDEQGKDIYEINHSNNNDKRHPVEADVKNTFYSENGISVSMGKYAHDVIADQDIYWENDEKLDNPYYRDNGDGTSTLIEYRHRKGDIRYRKGDVIHKEGDTFRMLPNSDNMIESQVKVNKIKPYVGIGYTCALDKKQRFHFAINAGVLFWGGKPTMDFETKLGLNAAGEPIYGTIDMISDLKDIPGKPGTYVKAIKLFTVWPEISIRFSQRF